MLANLVAGRFDGVVQLRNGVEIVDGIQFTFWWNCASYLYVMLDYTSSMILLLPKINEIIN